MISVTFTNGKRHVHLEDAPPAEKRLREEALRVIHEALSASLLAYPQSVKKLSVYQITDLILAHETHEIGQLRVIQGLQEEVLRRIDQFHPDDLCRIARAYAFFQVLIPIVFNDAFCERLINEVILRGPYNLDDRAITCLVQTDYFYFRGAKTEWLQLRSPASFIPERYKPQICEVARRIFPREDVSGKFFAGYFPIKVEFRRKKFAFLILDSTDLREDRLSPQKEMERAIYAKAGYRVVNVSLETWANTHERDRQSWLLSLLNKENFIQ